MTLSGNHMVTEDFWVKRDTGKFVPQIGEICPLQSIIGMLQMLLNIKTHQHQVCKDWILVETGIK